MLSICGAFAGKVKKYALFKVTLTGRVGGVKTPTNHKKSDRLSTNVGVKTSNAWQSKIQNHALF